MDTTKEHQVTEIYYPMGKKVPYLRSTGKPLECASPELQECDEKHYYAWVDNTDTPESLAGFQQVTNCVIRRGDLVIHPIWGSAWAKGLSGTSTIDNGDWRVYRKPPVANHADRACDETKALFDKRGTQEGGRGSMEELKQAVKVFAEHSLPTYRPLEPDEVIQDGDEYELYQKAGIWSKFDGFIGSTLDKEGALSWKTRTLRPKPEQPEKPKCTPDPKGEAGKLKPQLQLIPPVLNTETAKALALGADKYGPWNWRDNEVEIMTYLGAMKRHIDKVIEGEDIDPESGAYHLGHIAASCGIVLDANKHGNLIDNRPPKSAKDAV